MKIAVLGAGGVGGYFGGRLKAAGADVHLIARGEHLAALQAKGLRVRSDLGNLSLALPAEASPEAVGASDVVLFCVKATETAAAARTLAPLLSEDTAVISLQNGVDNEAVIADAIGPGHTVFGVAYILATIAEPGVIEHEGTIARLVFGERTGASTGRLEAFARMCADAGVDAELSTNIRAELWKKFAMICATAGMTAAVRLPLGEIRASSASLALYRRIVEEAVHVARAEGVELPGDTVERILSIVPNLPGEWYSSLHYDLTHGKPMELETLHGTLVRLAKAHGIAAPASEAIYGVLAPWASRNRSSK